MTYQHQVIKEMEAKGYTVLKTIRLNKAGYPDLLCLKDGTVTWIEVKEEKDTLKPLQKKRIDELKKLKFEAYCLQKNKGIIY